MSAIVSVSSSSPLFQTSELTTAIESKASGSYSGRPGVSAPLSGKGSSAIDKQLYSRSYDALYLGSISPRATNMTYWWALNGILQRSVPNLNVE